MAKKEQDFTAHFELARKKAKELGYQSLMNLDLKGTDKDKQLIQAIYRQPLPEKNMLL